MRVFNEAEVFIKERLEILNDFCCILRPDQDAIEPADHTPTGDRHG
ncbi:MAG: hypothetical protein QOH96_1643, partial [Blastocatellia bacterium]|nr:hypothetical protein [Blastocatellia bacterium]